MAQSRNPNIPTHQIFANQHNPGQKSTRHRSVEDARQQATKEGSHPQKGNFQYQPPPEKSWPTDGGSDPEMSSSPQPPSPDVSAKYSAPDGSGVEVCYHGANDPNTATLDDHDKQVSVNGKKFSKPAAREYAQNRFGISV